EGNFGNLMNLGPQVNTPFDEISPHFKNGEDVLYFSSNGHPGIGGFDIFKTYKNNGSWGLVINMGIPYNSALDDTYFSPDSGDETGFFVSNRKGGFGLDHATCCDNIYEIDSMPPPTTDFLIPLSGVIRDDRGTALIGAQVTLYQMVGEEPIWVDEMMSRNDGSYDLLLLNPNDYRVQVSYDGRVTQQVDFQTVEVREGAEFGKDFNLVEAKWILSGLVSEKTMEGEKDINSFVASLFDSYGNLLETKVGVTTNKYEFELEEGKAYFLLIEKVGYQAHNFECSTEDPLNIGPIQHHVQLIRNQ
ncbi:MAG: carboxypeptidase-like regulatory domain-containing protein, partial [Bacteroidota bacterium]